MLANTHLIKPQTPPPLDNKFRPAALYNRRFRKDVKTAGSSASLVLALERLDGASSKFETNIFAQDDPRSQENLFYIERIIKFLLWQKGGWKLYVGGQSNIGNQIRDIYAPKGIRSFDYHFMGEQVYQKPFTVVTCLPDEVPSVNERVMKLGGHLDGYRIGFDLGASDLKVSALVEGKPIFSQEIIWEPRQQSDPQYHKDKILSALKLAASKMPRLDAIGGSSAGVYINNQPMVASIFRGIPRERFGEVRNLFSEIQREMGVPLEVVNDGEVTALAGAMSLEDNRVLGIAMGSSEAAGYITGTGKITDWLNELAFAPVDYSPDAPIDEWSGDRGCGALYFSQQCVFRLAPKVDIAIPPELTDAEKLEFVQQKLEKGHEGAVKIWQSIGCYLGYAVAHYADFYDLKHVLILGRCTSGQGGPLILEWAKTVLKGEFPELMTQINIQLPDERSRRIGQSIAAASLTEMNKKG